MATSRVARGLTVQQWDDKFFVEYLQENRFSKYMGTDENSIIQVKQDLTKKQGDSVTFALLNKLKQAATTGRNRLKGNEEKLQSRSYRLYVDKRRHAVAVQELDEQYSAIDLRNGAKVALKDWAMEDTRDYIIRELGSIDGVAYADATEAQKDTWLTNNADRVLFGATRANASSNDHSTSLGNVDTTADLLTPAALSLMKEIATSIASPKIRPVTVNNDKRNYVVFCGTRTFRALKRNSEITQAQREVSVQMQNNKLFEGGDLYWDGMIIHEIDDIPVYTGVGAAGADVSPVYFCGAQAIGMAWAKRWRTIEDDDDYEDTKGCALDAIYGVGKMRFGTSLTNPDDTVTPKQHGLVTGYFAAPAAA